jgi:RNA polymerase sigma factor (sigma-70 family)
MTESVETAAQHLLREIAPQVLGAVARRHGDFADAEDAVQEALIAAVAQWRVAGIPSNPRGWLYQVAMRRLRDQLRSEAARRDREQAVAAESLDAEIGVEEDDSLLLLFMCCHPALTPATAIGLTLRAVGGLTTAEIANAFLVPEASMAQRISRAKQSIKSSGTPFSMPTERAARLAAVLQVLYLMFSEGYASSVGASLHRVDLSNEAIRLVRELHRALPHDGEVAGLLALLLLTDARREARTGPNGELIPLDAQDRARWNRSLIAEGVTLISHTLSKGAIGPYQLQAAIAAIHDEAPRVEDTDWPQILLLYGLLGRMTDNPMVTLSRAVARAMVEGPAAGLAMLDALDADPRLEGHYRLAAVRAHLLELAGDHDGAITHYRAAAERTTSVPEQHYLLTKAAALRAEAGVPRVRGVTVEIESSRE